MLDVDINFLTKIKTSKGRKKLEEGELQTMFSSMKQRSVLIPALQSMILPPWHFLEQFLVINPRLINVLPDQFCSNWKTSNLHFAKHGICCYCGTPISLVTDGCGLKIHIKKYHDSEELNEEDIVSTSSEPSFEMTCDDFRKLELYQMVIDGGRSWVR